MQEKFHDKHLKLRWNMLRGECQIWYSSTNDLYCILPIKDRYNFPKAMQELKQRMRSKKELAAEYFAAQEEAEKNNLSDIKQYTRQYADAMWREKVGRVSVTV
jgi:ubiquinone biosynthesis protein Coq4